MKNNIILFGGSFDPIHIAHIKMADFAFKKLDAKQLIFIPAKQSPFKKQRPLFDDDDRIKMIEKVIENRSNFSVSDFEIHRQSPSYTIDTVKHFANIFTSQIFVLIGADMLKDLHNWHKIDELLTICDISIMNRGGYEKLNFDNFQNIMGQKLTEKLKRNTIDTPFIEISSTEIREKLLNHQSTDGLLDKKVQNYIAQTDYNN